MYTSRRLRYPSTLFHETGAAARSLATLGCLILFVTMGCAQTDVQRIRGPEADKQMPRPDRVVVYDFAVSPEEVKVDRGVSAKIDELVEGTSRTEEERRIGRQVANALTEKLIDEIIKLGLPAEEGRLAQSHSENVLLIEDQFVSIDEGNRDERVVIGLGLGRTDVKTHVQVYEAKAQGRMLVEQFEVDAKSGRKPGMAETMGAGGAAGHLAVSAAVSTGMAVGSEAFAANVEADAERTAKSIAKELAKLFAREGWISPEAAE